jgi:hypothetical protein
MSSLPRTEPRQALCHMSILPDIVECICHFLPARDASALIRTCTRYIHFSSSMRLWTAIMKRDYPYVRTRLPSLSNYKLLRTTYVGSLTIAVHGRRAVGKSVLVSCWMLKDHVKYQPTLEPVVWVRDLSVCSGTNSRGLVLLEIVDYPGDVEVENKYDVVFLMKRKELVTTWCNRRLTGPVPLINIGEAARMALNIALQLKFGAHLYHADTMPDIRERLA